MKTRNLLCILAVFVLVAGFAYYIHVQIVSSSAPAYSDTYTAYDVLTEKDPAFVSGESLLAKDDFTGATAAFQQALPLASDDFQKGVIMYDLALIQNQIDPIGSIAAFEAIATNPTYAYVTRAYALQYIGETYNQALLTQSSSTTVQQIVSATFGGSSAFSPMLENGDVALAYRRIYDAADSLSPLPVAEGMSAEWYVGNLALITGSTTRSSDVAVYKAQIQSDLDALDTAVAAEQSDPDLTLFIAQALQTKADVLRQLSGLDLASKDDVVSAYQQALNASDATTSPALSDAFPRYDFAIYLSYAFGTASAAQVHLLLAPLYANPEYASGPLGNLLKSLAEGNSTIHKNAVLVSMIDPQFKSYLMSLGWTASDFKS